MQTIQNRFKVTNSVRISLRNDAIKMQAISITIDEFSYPEAQIIFTVRVLNGSNTFLSCILTLLLNVRCTLIFRLIVENIVEYQPFVIKFQSAEMNKSYCRHSSFTFSKSLGIVQIESDNKAKFLQIKPSSIDVIS